eukprot:GHVS01015931.1.p1 GENE.GHVS01015931.1~~GHVS01015931.1.p1  ORF type:complete len:160 (-),score=34.82 GHVS01015931.1:249-728(-)
MAPSLYEKSSGRGSLKLKAGGGNLAKKNKKQQTNKLTSSDNNNNTHSSTTTTSATDNINNNIDDKHNMASSTSPPPSPPARTTTTLSSITTCGLSEDLLVGDMASLTPAERSFRLAQQKREGKRVDERLKLTHRQKMERLNAHLASLSEHFDIPKVGPG